MTFMLILAFPFIYVVVLLLLLLLLLGSETLSPEPYRLLRLQIRLLHFIHEGYLTRRKKKGGSRVPQVKINPRTR